MMHVWKDLMAVVEQVKLNDDSDALLCVYEKSRIYSSHSFYAIISYRGVTPMYIPAIWNKKIQLFLWLFHGKLATVDNINRKGKCKPEQCCFCNEKESIDHLFFDCAVAKVMWGFTSEFLGWEIRLDYFSVASKWIQKVNLAYVNVISSAVLRAIWLMRNDMCRRCVVRYLD
jgi:hypothetical protein